MTGENEFPYLLLNGLFIVTILTGVLGIYLTIAPGAAWFALIWALWILANYLFIIRLKLCRHCFYYGKRCPLGWGALISSFFSKGDLNRFHTQRWPIVYLVSHVILPSLLIVISLIFKWDLFLFSVLIIFEFLCLILFLLARTNCCYYCKMEPVCLLSKFSKFYKMVIDLTRLF